MSNNKVYNLNEAPTNHVEKIDVTDVGKDNASNPPSTSAFTGFVGAGFKAIDQVLNDKNKDQKNPVPIFSVPNKNVVNNRASNRFSQVESYYSQREKQAFLASLVSQARKTKKDIIEAVDSVRDMYLVGAILETFDEEATAKSNDAFNLVDISSPNPIIERYAKAFQREIDIDALVGSITEDLCAYGEYILRVNPDPNNFQVFDDVIQSDVVAVYKSSQLFPEYFLSGLVRNTISSDLTLSRIKSVNYVHFCLGKRKIKVIVNAKDLSGVRITKYPYYVRIGKSLIYNVLDKLLQLDLLEKLAPTSYLSSLAGSNLIGIQVPSTMDPKTVLSVTRKYEKMLNGVFDLEGLFNLTGTIDPDKLITNASRYKVVPLWGDKGQMERLDLQRQFDTTDSVSDTRDTILNTIGIPTGLINGGESKTESLKQYSRFVRKLIMIQQAIKSGVMQLFIIYLSAHGVTANPQEVNVKLTNTLIDVTQFDRLEASDMIATIVKNIIDMFDQVQGFVSGADENSIFDKKKLLTQISNIIGSTGFGDTLKISDLSDNKNEDTDSSNGMDIDDKINNLNNDEENELESPEVSEEPELNNDNNKDNDTDFHVVDASSDNSGIPDKVASNGDLLL